MHRYRAWGLTIDSELDIPGAILMEAGGVGSPDLTVMLGSSAFDEGILEEDRAAPSQRNLASADNGPYVRVGDRMLFSAPGVAQYMASGNSTLTVAPYDGADPEEVRGLFIATALPMMLWIRGDWLLHAAGVHIPGSAGAVAIAGDSGAGKSSVAHALLRRGSALIGDDSLRLTNSGASIEVSGLPASYFLSSIALDSRTSNVVPTGQRLERAMLSAVVVIEVAEAERMRHPQQLGRTDAVAALYRHRHRHRVPTVLRQEQRSFEQCAFAGARVPVFVLGRSRNPTTDTWSCIADSIHSLETLRNYHD